MLIESTRRKPISVVRSDPTRNFVDSASEAPHHFDRVDIVQPKARRAGWKTSSELLSVMIRESSGRDMRTLAADIASSQEADGGWKADSSAQASDLDTAIINHVTLATYLRRVEHAADFGKHHSKERRKQYTLDEVSRKRLDSALAKSWTYLSKRAPEGEHKFLGALPSKVTSKASRGPHALHEALLGDSLEVRLEAEEAVEKALELVDSGARGEELQAQTKKPFGLKRWAKALAAGAGVVGACVLAAPAVIGAGVGWMAASFHESWLHDKITHIRDLHGPVVVRGVEQPRSLNARICEKIPKLKEAFHFAHFGHTTIHHYRTYKHDNVTQFRNKEEEDRLKVRLAKIGREDMIDEEYGSALSWKGFARFQAVAIPGYVLELGAIAGMAALAGFAPISATGALFLAGFAAPTALYPLLTKEYHRYIHMPADMIKERASKPMQAFINTKLSRHVVRHHMVHHDDDTTNFNLMPGADFVRGVAKKASVAQEEEFRRMGVVW